MIRRLVFVLVVALGMLTMLAAPASATSIIVSQTSVPVGGVVVISGDTTTASGQHCAAGDEVTLISNVFVGHAEFAGVGAVVTPVDATGHYRVSVTVLTRVRAGRYTITARCGGGNLGVVATLTVSGLPRTGASTEREAGVALALLLAGSGAIAGARRRRHTVRVAGRTP